MAVLTFAGLTLFGWFARVEALVRLRPEWPVTVPVAALALALLAVAALLGTVDTDRARRIAQALAVGVTVVGVAATWNRVTGGAWFLLDEGLLPHVADWQPGLASPARPTLLMGLQMIAIGSFLVIEPAAGRRVRLALWAVAVTALAATSITLVGYLGGDPALFERGNRLGPSTAVMVAVLWAAVLTGAAPRLGADHPAWVGPSTRTLLRRIGPLLVLLAPVVAALDQLAQRVSWMDPTTTVASVSVVMATGAIGFVVTTGRRLDEAQLERRRTTELLRGVVDTLEEGLVVRDASGQVVVTNPAMDAVTGLPFGHGPSAAEVAADSGYRSADGSPAELPSVRASRDGTAVVGELGTIERPDGEVRWVRTNAVPGLRIGPSGDAITVTTVTDVTDEQRTATALAAAEERFRLLFEQAPIGLASVAPDGRFEAVNTSFCELVARPSGELLGGTFQEITHPDDLASDEKLLADLAAGRIPRYTLDKRYVRPDGTEVWVALHVAALRDDDGEVQRYLAQVVDLADRKRLEQALTDAATRDPLTGAANRRLLDDRLEHAQARASREPDRRAALFFLDLDGFKTVNDQHGHDVGDAMLTTTVVRLREVVRDADTVARVGGDEFVVLVDDLGTEDDAAALHTRIVATVSRPIHLDRLTITPAVSVGVLVYAPAATPPQEALRTADARMYAAKRSRHEAVRTRPELAGR